MINLIINAMDVPILSAQHFVVILPVAAVVILAVLVFAFGFQKTVDPPSFKQLNYPTDDKKSKKKKIKEKKPQSNGHAVVIDVADSKKIDTPKVAKPTKVETPKPKKTADIEKEKKNEAQKSPNKKEKKQTKENVEVKSKKSAQKPAGEKPADFDDGEWETAPSRKDKKKKKDDQEIVATYSPEKANKKSPVGKKDIAKKIEVALEMKPIEILRLEDILPPKKEEVVAPVAAEPVVIEPIAPVAEAAAVSEEQSSKKKKNKKPKTSAAEEEVAVPKETTQKPAHTEPAEIPTDSQPQVFNEMEDDWKDAPQKKSKKKVRKD